MPLTPGQLEQLAEFTAARLQGSRTDAPAPDLAADSAPSGPVFVVARNGGLRITSAWARGNDWIDALTTAIDELRHELHRRDEADVDAVEICLTHAGQSIDLHRDRAALANIHRGIHGLELRHGEALTRYAPTEMIARNLSFDRAIERFAEQHDLPQGDRLPPELQARIFDAEQVLVMLRPSPRAVRMFRGNVVVRLEEVTRPHVQALAAGMGDWLARQVHDDGRVTYKYWPSRGEESSANNMIRQWMATICLGRWSERRDDAELNDRYTRNLAYNLDHFYRVDGELGLIAFDGKVKLGAVALAALAVHEARDRERYRDQAAALARTIDHLWQADGEFRTFYEPATRNDNQNFYPGEALLYWAVRYRETRDDALLARFMTSIAHYRDWHLTRRNPAFVPWHTQACFIMWQTTHDPELAAWIFEMNDWLLAMQQWTGKGGWFPDIRGRFYNPERPDWGPPHASSTGVYLEGLTDAFTLAREIGETRRQDRYRIAIVRGLRSVMQLAFTDEIDMYYVSNRDRVRGGIRTTVYDNTIRVDNVQHNLMAVMKVLDAFGPRDFQVE